MDITAPAQIITAPAQLITAPAQPPATGVVVYTALFPNYLLNRVHLMAEICFDVDVFLQRPSFRLTLPLLTLLLLLLCKT